VADDPTVIGGILCCQPRPGFVQTTALSYADRQHARTRASVPQISAPNAVTLRNAA
jgi:hypothetical protein